MATIKIPQIISAFSEIPNISIRVILTENAARFLAGQSAEQPTVAALQSLPKVAGVHLDENEWNPAWTRDSKILHIELRRWADGLVIAPMSANLLAKVANGLCDDLLTSVIRAWETDGEQTKRILVAPAMNTYMYVHPVTAKHLKTLQEWNWMQVLTPQGGKELACGDIGAGAMMEWKEIVQAVKQTLHVQ